MALLPLALICLLAESRGDAPLSLTYEGKQLLPNFEIDGQAAVIHSQGLYVTDEHYFVSGRLETPPKRALFVRFDQSDPKQYQYIDITPDLPSGVVERLDHPGGFDFDGQSFWVPVAASRPRTPTAIIRIDVAKQTPPDQWKRRVAFRVDDHIGAIAWEPTSGLLFGANWDTKRIYAWTPSGELVREIDCSEFVKEDPYWQLAIQDWKTARHVPFSRAGLLIAGGIDKSPRRDRNTSSAVVELLDVNNRTRLARIHLPPREGFKGPLTNEGLAVRGDRLYLLPGDLGRNAVIFRFRMESRCR